MRGRTAKSFRITARRADKRFPIPSPDLERAVGAPRSGGDRLAGQSFCTRDGHSHRGADRRRVFLLRTRAGRRWLAGRNERPRHVPALRRDRLAGRGVADDSARLPGVVRPLSQLSDPVPHVAGQGARAGHSADASPVAVAPVSRAVRRHPATRRRRRAVALARRRLPPPDGADRGAARPASRRTCAGHRRCRRPGGVADRRQPRRRRQCRDDADPAAVGRVRQGRDHGRGDPAWQLRDVDRARRRLLHAVHAAVSGHARAAGRSGRRRGGSRYRRARGARGQRRRRRGLQVSSASHNCRSHRAWNVQEKRSEVDTWEARGNEGGRGRTRRDCRRGHGSARIAAEGAGEGKGRRRRPRDDRRVQVARHGSADTPRERDPARP